METTINDNQLLSSAAKSAPSKDSLTYWKKRIRKRAGSPFFYLEVQADKVRKKLSLQTSIPNVAAARAREIASFARLNGWEATLSKYRPNRIPDKASTMALGAFCEAASVYSAGNSRSRACYRQALLRIARGLLEASGQSKARAEGLALSFLTPERIRQWKTQFLEAGPCDPVSMRSKRITVNSTLRLARSLFSARILKHFPEITDPFKGLEFERRPSMKYRGDFDAAELLTAARDELALQDPESFKTLLLALCTGLRRGEIDRLKWRSIRFSDGLIRVEANEFFAGKSEDSLGDVACDPEVLEVLRGFRGRSTSDFVIESDGRPQVASTYHHYRCQAVFEKLAGWLRQHGVCSRRPLHQLRKEFGSLINQTAGIHAASSALRHSDIAITAAHYVDNRRMVVSGLGALLKADPNKVVELREAV